MVERRSLRVVKHSGLMGLFSIWAVISLVNFFLVIASNFTILNPPPGVPVEFLLTINLMLGILQVALVIVILYKLISAVRDIELQTGMFTEETYTINTRTRE